MMKTMGNNKEKIINFETEQVYSYGSLMSRTDIVMPVSRRLMTSKFFIGTQNSSFGR